MLSEKYKYAIEAILTDDPVDSLLCQYRELSTPDCPEEETETPQSRLSAFLKGELKLKISKRLEEIREEIGY